MRSNCYEANSIQKLINTCSLFYRNRSKSQAFNLDSYHSSYTQAFPQYLVVFPGDILTVQGISAVSSSSVATSLNLSNISRGGIFQSGGKGV